jgi:hypothetical protein
MVDYAVLHITGIAIFDYFFSLGFWSAVVLFPFFAVAGLLNKS